jgi:hypothetical protein
MLPGALEKSLIGLRLSARAQLVPLEHEPEVVKQFALEADTVRADARSECQPELAAGEEAGDQASLHSVLRQLRCANRARHCLIVSM